MKSNKPYVVGKLKMGKNNRFGKYVVIRGSVTIGNDNVFYDNVIIGNPAQHTTHDIGKIDCSKEIVIGNGNIIREGVSVHKPIDKRTVIGNKCYIMCNTHIPHDAILGDKVVITSGTNMAGFVRIMNNTTIGLNVCIHQYTTIGSFVMVGMGSVVTKDIPPFSLVYGNPATVRGLNEVGMKRAGLWCDSLKKTLIMTAEMNEFEKISNRRK